MYPTPAFPRTTAAGLVLGPLLLLASSVIYSTEGGVNEGEVGGTVGVWSVIALAIGLVGLAQALSSAAPRGSAVLSVLAVMMCAGGTAFNVQAIFLDLYGNEVVGETESPPFAFFAFLPWGWCAPVSFIVAGVLIWRTKAFAIWTGALLALGGVLFVTGRPARIDAIAIGTDVVLTVALVTIGVQLLRQATRPAETGIDQRVKA